MPAENRDLKGHLFATAGYRALYKSNQFDFARFVESVKSKQWNVTLKTSQKDF